MNDETSSQREDDSQLGLFAILSAGLFLLRISEWLRSDLWYDEVVTLGDFAIGPSRAGILHVFRSYPVANNHVLFSAVAWCWVRITQFNPSECLLRAPSVLFGVLTLICITLQWRKWLGARVACFAGLFFAISPVFGAFAYQFRGYSLSMLLGTLAVTAAMELADGSTRRGIALYVPVALLAPLVIPTNALLVAGHLLFLAWWRRGELALGPRLLRLAPVAVGLACGSSYYLLIWPQFVKAAGQTAGWRSAWLVVGNLALAMLAHVGPLLLVFVLDGLARLRRRDERRTEGGDPEPAWPLFLGCVIPIAAFLGLAPRAPFPRVFLVFVPTFSFCVFRVCRRLKLWRSDQLLLIAGLVVMHGFLWGRCAMLLTRRQVRAGEHPQNLLQQYYRSSTSFSQICQWVAGNNLGQTTVVVTNAHDFPSFRYYWGMAGAPTDQVLTENRDAREPWRRRFPHPALKLVAVASNELEAARLFRTVGETGNFRLVFAARGRSLYAQTSP